jgi:hypothetical protein
MLILTNICAVIFILMVIVVGFILPIWCILDCAISHRHNTAKIIWILVTLFSWTVGAFFYGLLITKQKVLKRVTIASFAIGVIAAGYLGWSYVRTSHDLDREMTTVQMQMKGINLQALSSTQKDRLKAQLDLLQDNADLSLYSELRSKVPFSNKIAVHDLLFSLSEKIQDGNLTKLEYKMWNEEFKAEEQRMQWEVIPTVVIIESGSIPTAI